MDLYLDFTDGLERAYENSKGDSLIEVAFL